MKPDVHEPALSWEREDVERRLGLPAGRFTDAEWPLSLTLGIFLAVAFYLATTILYHPAFEGTALGMVAPMFHERGPIPYFETGLTAWSLAILWVKSRKLKLQRKALDIEVVPESADFVLSPDTADRVLDRIERAVDDPRRFVLFSRMVTVLSNLRNMGRISDVDEMFAKQADIAEDMVDSGFSLLKGFVWAIPVLGFIGTVLGLSDAIGSFASVLTADGADMGEIKDGLRHITAGLSVAFDTTLIGLVQALIVQMLLLRESRAEQRFLDDCREYCHRRVVGRLRILPLEAD